MRREKGRKHQAEWKKIEHKTELCFPVGSIRTTTTRPYILSISSGVYVITFYYVPSLILWLSSCLLRRRPSFLDLLKEESGANTKNPFFFCCFFVSKIVVNNRSVSANFSWANSKIHFFTQLRYALNKRWRGKMQMGEKKAGEGGRSVMVSKLQILFTEQTG